LCSVKIALSFFPESGRATSATLSNENRQDLEATVHERK
jgi:hypothetical protein